MYSNEFNVERKTENFYFEYIKKQTKKNHFIYIQECVNFYRYIFLSVVRYFL